VRFLHILREEFEQEAQTSGQPRLLLTAAVGVGKQNADLAYNIPAMSLSLDLISMMTYDLHGAWDDVTGFNAPLYATDADTNKFTYPLSVSWAVDYWLDHGARPDQLLLGFASYGRGFKLSQKDCTSPLCPVSGPCAMGSATREKGYLAYYEIQDMIKKGAVRHFDDERKAPYIVTKNGEWVGYDDVESYKYKLDYLKQKGLRGTIVWAIDLDDMTSYPLLNTLKKALRGESELDEHTSEPPKDTTDERLAVLWNEDTFVLFTVSAFSLSIFVIGFVILCLWKRTKKQDENHFTLNQGILTFWTPEDIEEPVDPIITL